MSKTYYSCPACKAGSTKTFMDNCKDILCGCPGEWSLVECEECGMVSLAPMPTLEHVKRFYPANYAPYHTTQPLRGNPVGAMARRLAILPYTLRFGEAGLECAPFGRGRFLEVGCGAGSFLRTMADLGWQSTGIDISPVAIEAAHSNAPGSTLHLGTLEDFPSEGQYDLIVMCHVLEHLADPVSCLKRCFELLAPTGMLFIGIPNLGSFEANVFSRYWVGLDVPRHLGHFREPVMVKLLEQCGYKVEQVRPQFFASSLTESLIFLLPGSLRAKVLGSRIKRLFYLAMVLPASISYFLGNRPILEYRARKPANA